MISINNVKVSFNEKMALDINKTIEINDGDRVGIIGSNGAGKTTLIKAILGLVDYKGTIKTSVASEDIAVHMQNNEYIDTVNIRTIMEAILGQKLEDNKEVMDMIEFFDFKDCLKKRFKHLSGGQKQRLTLILVICQNSPITMFDEVTSGLDFETRQRLMDKLDSFYKDKNTTLLITSHYYEELDNLANKILYLDKGKVIDYGYKDELFKKYCGNSIIIFPEKFSDESLIAGHKRIKGPKDSVVLSCENSFEEVEIIKKLSERNINFVRSNKDIEVMTINAKARFYGEE